MKNLTWISPVILLIASAIILWPFSFGLTTVLFWVAVVIFAMGLCLSWIKKCNKEDTYPHAPPSDKTSNDKTSDKKD
jgi:4-hydroxybenzoate polyprenyltransferase